MKKNKIVFLLALVFPLSILASIIHVPGDQPTIQAGVNAASNGDTVLVANGIYKGEGNRDIDFGGKAITVKSEKGPHNCVINCEGSSAEPHRGFYFHSDEAADSIVQGFKIKNGYGDGSDMYDKGGGGIFCRDGASPTIIDNIITGNTGTRYGGGILCRGSSPTIMHNKITANTAGHGGGIASISGSPTIHNNDISGNTAIVPGGSNAEGGGIYIKFYTHTSITCNTISGNAAEGSGGDGGGIAFDAGGMIENNIIINNYAYYGGGGIFTTSSPTIRNNFISQNEAALGGGFYCAFWGEAMFTGNTVTDNGALDGGGIAMENTSLTVTNTILWDNTAAWGPEIYCDGWDWPKGRDKILSISYSDLQGGFGGIYDASAGVIGLNWGDGMIDSIPLFVRGPLGVHYLSQTAAGQSVDSPCIDAGDQLSPLDGGTTRSDSVPDSGIIDMGYHYPASGDFTCSAICLTPIVHPGEQVRFDLSVQNLTNKSQVVSAGTKIYLCNGAFLLEDLYFPYAPFNPDQLVEVTRVLNVPASVPSLVKNCDLRYELFIRDRITKRLIWSSSCYFQIQD